jgi:predicted O-methyltransferase YrrM
MPIIARLKRLYEERGIRVVTGLDPSRLGGFAQAPFTWLVKDGASLTNGLGIALQEVYLLECLFDGFHPARIFAIGNAWGWSTLALALSNPAARVVAIDAGYDRNARAGIEFTNRVAEEEGLAACAVEGVSPGDVAQIVARHALAPLDFVLIDGGHSIAQVELDFDAVWPLAARHCLYLFHDVETFGLHRGLERIAAKSGLAWELLLATPSGMAVLYDRASPPAALDGIAPFAADAEALEILRRAAWDHRHRHLARWRRSLGKRFPALGADRRGSAPTGRKPGPAGDQKPLSTL